MNKEKVHDNLSRFFFVAAFIANALYHITPVFIGRICKLAAIGCNYAGYLFWLASAQVSKDQERLKNKWYAFAKIKNQHRLTSLLGVLATTLALIGFFIPVMLIPAFWLFTLSNIIWAITTFHQKRNLPQDDPRYTPKGYDNYFNYVILSTAASVVAAIGTTLIFCFPAATLPILIIVMSISALITLPSLSYLVESVNPDGFDLSHTFEPSYQMMNNHMPNRQTQRFMPTPDNRQTKSIFHKNIHEQSDHCITSQHVQYDQN